MFSSTQGGVLVSDDAVGYFERNRIYDNRVTGVEIKNEGNPVFIDNEIYGAQASGVIVYRQGRIPASSFIDMVVTVHRAQCEKCPGRCKRKIRVASLVGGYIVIC